MRETLGMDSEAQGVEAPGGEDELAEQLLKLAETCDLQKLYQLILDYTQTLVLGAGCSIFKVDPRDDKLHIVASSHIPKDEWEKATYARGEGFTGWVFQQGKLLYIPDEADEEYVGRIQPPVEHKGREAGKPCETVPIGPLMIAPIRSEGFVIGVIRAPATRGEKKEYTAREQRIFAAFAERLASSIENASQVEKYERLIRTYREMHSACGRAELLDTIVQTTPDIVDAAGCSIFLFDGHRTPDGRKKFVLETSTGIQGVEKELLGICLYEEGGHGVTAWAATTGKPVRLSDVDATSESTAHVSESDPPIRHWGRLCEIPNLGPFMAVPIKDTHDEVIGVIRVPKFRGSKPFTDTDEDLLVGFAEQMALSMEAVERREELARISQKRLKEVEDGLSRPLIEAGKEVAEVDYADEIHRFLRFEDSDKDLDEHVMSSLEMLWRVRYDGRYSFVPLANFREFEPLLFELPGYRAHFIHQYQVFLLGAVIIDELYKHSARHRVRSFSDLYCDTLGRERNRAQADVAWMIASTFHDVAYPVEKVNLVFDAFFHRFMGFTGKVLDELHVDKVIFDRHGRYMKLIDQLCDLYVSLRDGKARQWTFDGADDATFRVDDGFRRAVFDELIENRDHGIVGGLILLRQNEPTSVEYSSMVYPAALAICLHNRLGYATQDSVVFERNPLAFLLMYCDAAQEWGREGKYAGSAVPRPQLVRVTIRPSEDDGRMLIQVIIRLTDEGQVRHKEEELERVFGILRSAEAEFSIIIENSGRQFASRRP